MTVYNLMTTKIGVFYNDLEWARYLLNKFVEQMQDDIKQNVLKIVFVQPQMGIYMKDGSCIKFMRVSENARGYKFDKAIIENSVTADRIEEVIKPCLTDGIIHEWMV